MTSQQAREVLREYRPWVDDAADPEIAAALALCRTDEELAKWFAVHCAMQSAIRSKLQTIKPPEGLAQQIVSECRAQIRSEVTARQKIMAALAVGVIMVSSWFIWKSLPSSPREDLSFNGYRNRMTRTALRAYGMDLETNDVAVIRRHLAENQAPADFSIPAALNQASVVGCGVLRWQNQPVTMVCFQTGHPLPAGMKSDLILFVAKEPDVLGEESLTGTQFHKVSDWYTASWRTGGRVYLLAAASETELRKRL